MTRPAPHKGYSQKDRVIDELLVLHILGGDQRAVDRLGRRWQPRLLRVAQYLTGDLELAETAAQETWIGICRGWFRLREASQFSPWAFGILRRKCQEAIRRKVRLKAQGDKLMADFPKESLGLANEDRLAVSQAFAALSEDHREAARLFFLEGLTLAEIAALLNIPMGTAKSRIFHARRKLKAHLKGENK